MDKESTGCFAWIVNFKQSCNERWARFRNRLRRRFYARRGQTIDPSTIVNETGTRDMVITKTYKTKKILPENLAAPGTTAKECPEDVVTAPATGINEGIEKTRPASARLIKLRLPRTLCMERQALPGNTNAIMENSADNVSLSPSIISQIANIAVTESLSNIVLESDVNQSAIHRDIKEFMVQMTLKLLERNLMMANLRQDYNC